MHCRRALLLASSFVGGLFTAAPAWAQRALPSAELERPRAFGTEVSVVPFVGGDTDYGFGGGAIGAFEAYAPNRAPYFYRIEAAGSATFKGSAEGWPLHVPYQDFYVELTWNVLENLRLLARASHTRESLLNYSGVGNASVAPTAENSPTGDTSYFQWAWTHPAVRIGAKVKLDEIWSVQLRNYYIQNWFDIPQPSKLRADHDSDDPELEELVSSITSGAVFLNEYALIYDDRDSEAAPERGQYHQLTFRLAPGPTGFAPHRYAQTNLTLRLYVSPVPSYLTIALRGVTDLLYGTVPFYELGRVNDAFVLGGASGVRGVTGQRYYGKIKIFGNLEMRSSFLPFWAFDKRCVLGAALFVDAGRVFADYSSNPALDGTGLGLKYGIGGGPRLRVGKPLVLRIDLAYSPDGPFGAYFLAGNTF